MDPGIGSPLFALDILDHLEKAHCTIRKNEQNKSYRKKDCLVVKSPFNSVFPGIKIKNSNDVSLNHFNVCSILCADGINMWYLKVPLILDYSKPWCHRSLSCHRNLYLVSWKTFLPERPSGKVLLYSPQ